MNPLLSVPADFAALLQRFFAERLIQQQNASPKTVTSYRDSFRLLLTYAERERGKPPAKLTLGDFDAALVLDFLAHLEPVHADRRTDGRSRPRTLPNS